ncbi:MAG: hypothetical protein U5L96_19885 [Owenweeksia sp.]|nr:hypothetical protein [Owenweeksia sp.]
MVGARLICVRRLAPPKQLIFGDINDHDSRVYKLKQDKRMYHLLEEVGTQPSVCLSNQG